MGSNKIIDALKKNIGNIITALICLIYLATSIVHIEESGRTVLQIIGESSIYFVMSSVVSKALSIQGQLIGESNPLVIATNELHSAIVVRISDYLDLLDGWCVIKNKENLKNQRLKILAINGMKYCDYFDEDGNAKPFEFKVPTNKKEKRIQDAKYKAYCKALKLKLTQLTASELTSESSNKNDIYNFGRTRLQYGIQSTAIGLVWKIVLSFAVGYYGIKLVEDFSYANLIWKSLQVIAMLSFGLISLLQAVLFVVHELRSRTVRRIDILQMFEIYAINKKKEKENGYERQT